MCLIFFITFYFMNKLIILFLANFPQLYCLNLKDRLPNTIKNEIICVRKWSDSLSLAHTLTSSFFCISNWVLIKRVKQRIINTKLNTTLYRITYNALIYSLFKKKKLIDYLNYITFCNWIDWINFSIQRIILNFPRFPLLLIEFRK